jgi:hypothetical protein
MIKLQVTIRVPIRSPYDLIRHFARCYDRVIFHGGN